MCVCLLHLTLWPKIRSILEKISWATEMKIYSAVVGWSVLLMSVGSIWLMAFFRDEVSVDFKFVWLTGDRDVLKSPSIIVLKYFWSFMLSIVCFVELGALLFEACVFNILTSPSLFPLLLWSYFLSLFLLILLNVHFSC